MNVLNLSGKALSGDLRPVSVPPDTLDEIHTAIQSGAIGRLSDLMLRCQIEKLVFKNKDSIPMDLMTAWPDVVIVVN